MREGIPEGKAELDILAPRVPSSAPHLRDDGPLSLLLPPVRQLDTHPACCKGLKLLQLPQHLEVPGASAGEGSGGKAGLCTCAAGEERGDGDPLESLQNGSSREVNPHESSFISPAAHGGMLLVQASSSEELKRQETTNSCMGIVNKTQNLQSMITPWWWPAWWIPLDLRGAWTGCYFALGIWNVIWMWWCLENKATLPLWQNKHLSIIFFLF